MQDMEVVNEFLTKLRLKFKFDLNLFDDHFCENVLFIVFFKIIL